MESGDAGDAEVQNQSGKQEWRERTPGILFDLGVQMIVPALSALLARATIQKRSNERPFLGAMLLYQIKDLLKQSQRETSLGSKLGK